MSNHFVPLVVAVSSSKKNLSFALHPSSTRPTTDPNRFIWQLCFRVRSTPFIVTERTHEYPATYIEPRKSFNMLASAREAMLGPSEPTWQQELDDACCGSCPKMSYKHRLIGCGCCVGIGFLLEFGSFARLVTAIRGDAGGFAIFYTLGNIVAFCGSFFLVGPRRQFNQMTSKNRVGTVAVMLLAMGLTFFFALFQEHNDDALGGRGGRFVLIVVCMLVQLFAIIWYTLSYIPFARDMIYRGCSRMVRCPDNV